MTTVTMYTAPEGNVEVRTNAGAPPMVFLNGVIQQPGTYSVSGSGIIFDNKQPIKLNWSKWFAWRPVKLNGRYVVFKTIYRAWDCTKIHHGFGGKGGLYVYGTIFDVLK